MKCFPSFRTRQRKRVRNVANECCCVEGFFVVGFSSACYLKTCISGALETDTTNNITQNKGT